MAAHRYWRAYFTASNGTNVVAFAELILRTQAGGASVATGGTAMASSNNDTSAHYMTNAFDGNVSTKWASVDSQPMPQWLGYDFGPGNEKDIVEFSIQGRNDQWVYQGPKDFSLQYSDDGVRWFPVRYVTGELNWQSSEIRSWSVPAESAHVAHRHWRLLLRANNSDANNNAAIAEIQLRETLGGANFATGGTASASSQWDGNYSAAQAFDGNTGNPWHTAGGQGPGSWIAYDLGAGVAKDVEQVALRARSDSSSLHAPKDFDVQWSDDGATWTTKFVVSGVTGWAQGEQRVIPPSPGSHRFWRLYVTAIDDAGAGYCGLSEIEFFPAGASADVLTSSMAITQAGDGAVGGPYSAVDNNQGTECGSNFNIGYYWWRADLGLGAERMIDRMSIRSQRVIPRRAPKDFRLEWSDDGTTWTTQGSKTGQSNWAEYERREFVMLTRMVDGTVLVAGAAAAGRTVRIYNRTTGALLASGTTDAAGAFSIDAANTGELQVLCLDDAAGTTYNDLIHRVAAAA